jgi:hypothetical protein
MTIKRLFGQLTKVDEATRRVYGTLAQEVVDRSGEIMDYDTTKVEIQKWSDGMSKASGGKNLGNIRAMHTANVAAGKLVSIDFDDANKAVTGCAEIVDDAEWEKVLKGVYTGFSIGGKYLRKWADGVHKGVTRYTASVIETSLVDLPCIPTATFDIAKADGTIIKASFMSYSPSNEDVRARAIQMAKTAGKPESKASDYVHKAREALIAEHATAVIDATAEDRAEGAESDVNVTADPEEGGEDGAGIDPDTDAEQSEEDTESEAQRKVADPLAALDEAIAKAEKAKDDKPYGDVTYADPGYQADKKERYPLDSVKHIRAAWSYINKEKDGDKYSADQLDKIKAKIIAAWKDKIDAKGPPSAEKMAIWGDFAKASKAVEALSAKSVAKGLYQVSSFASLLSQFGYLQASCDAEAEREGDGSTVPDQLAEAIAVMGDILIQMAREEVAELVADMKDDEPETDGIDPDVLECCAKMMSDIKADTDLMAKFAPATAALDAEAHALALANDGLSKALVERAIPQIEALTKTIEDMRVTHAEALAKRDEMHAAAIDELAKRVSLIEGEPVRKTAGSAHVSIEKQADGGSNSNGARDESVQDLLSKMTPEEIGLLQVRAALRNPQPLTQR